MRYFHKYPVDKYSLCKINLADLKNKILDNTRRAWVAPQGLIV